ncbi:hypothetical protein L596_021127 [Steinernema carpocapsae]|uniref:DNTTIP1 dimerisation domain-containing protein n=1 Tax=Steinernema carpocapsae TaxID=34508 RepID=A0A4U5MVT3_STECR|nr:hypothetical protein L596_021127 [Steinernema carpocapsae]
MDEGHNSAKLLANTKLNMRITNLEGLRDSMDPSARRNMMNSHLLLANRDALDAEGTLENFRMVYQDEIQDSIKRTIDGYLDSNIFQKCFQNMASRGAAPTQQMKNAMCRQILEEAKSLYTDSPPEHPRSVSLLPTKDETRAATDSAQSSRYVHKPATIKSIYYRSDYWAHQIPKGRFTF